MSAVSPQTIFQIEQSLEINRPVRTVYNQWTQFEDFPAFMEGVKSVRQLDDKRLEWVADITGKEKTWQAEIFEQEPDKRIAWRSMTGAMNTGRVDFEALDEDRTWIYLRLNTHPASTDQVEQLAAELASQAGHKRVTDEDRTRAFKQMENRAPNVPPDEPASH